MADGSKPLTISEVPLDWCFGLGLAYTARHVFSITHWSEGNVG